MNIRSLRWIHWLLISVVAGGVVGFGNLLSQGNEQVGGAGFISQREFEQALLIPSIGGQPCIASMIAYPGGNTDLISLQLLDPVSKEYRTAHFAAARPYRPLGKTVPASANYTVSDYVAHALQANPSLKLRHAWWRESRAFVLIRLGMVMLIGGGLWPLLLRWIYGPTESTAFNVGGAAVPVPGRPTQQWTEDDRRHLEALEAEMMNGLPDAEDESTHAETAKQPCSDDRAPRTLTVEALMPAGLSASEPKDYEGEFYPVETNRSHHGFTLTEILVVVGIVAVLTAIAIPAISLASRNAQKAKCASNLRQVGLGLEAYQQTHRALPIVTTPRGLNDAMNEINVRGIMTCPADSPDILSYAMNGAFAGLPKTAGNAGDILASEVTGRHDNAVYFDGHVDQGGGSR